MAAIGYKTYNALLAGGRIFRVTETSESVFTCGNQSLEFQNLPV
jgi:hypothetical protein